VPTIDRYLTIFELILSSRGSPAQVTSKQAGNLFGRMLVVVVVVVVVVEDLSHFMQLTVAGIQIQNEAFIAKLLTCLRARMSQGDCTSQCLTGAK